jgi:hypothetical protein
MRYSLLTWLKTQGIHDALIQPHSGHSSRKSPRSSRLAVADAQLARGLPRFPVGPQTSRHFALGVATLMEGIEGHHPELKGDALALLAVSRFRPFTH